MIRGLLIEVSPDRRFYSIEVSPDQRFLCIEVSPDQRFLCITKDKGFWFSADLL